MNDMMCKMVSKGRERRRERAKFDSNLSLAPCNSIRFLSVDTLGNGNGNDAL